MYSIREKPLSALGSTEYRRNGIMNERWDLTPIYAGLEAPEFASDLEKLDETVKSLEAFAKKLPRQDHKAALLEALDLEEQLVKLVNKLAGYASLEQSADTRNSAAMSAMGRVIALDAASAAPLAAIKEWIGSLEDLDALTEQDPVLKDYAYLLQRIQKDKVHQLPGIGEEVVAKLSQSDAWADMHQHLTSTVAVHYRGETTNLSAIRNLAYSDDPSVRKDAYEAELACYDAIKDPVAFALNSLKLKTITMSQLRGYASPLDMVLENCDMRQETLDAMFAAMDAYLPKFWQYLKAKGMLLGHENGLPWYDLFAPVGKSSRTFTTQQARDYLVELFSRFDEAEAQMIARAFDNAWIDFFPRDGKAGGAFCAGVESLGESRILTNFDGQMGDVVTLAHELGHAFHNENIRAHRPLNKDYSMPVAETASTFNECVVMAAAIGDAADDAEKLALIESQLSDATQVICDIYSRFRFEREVFQRREQEFLNSDTLCDIMLRAQKASYGDGLDETVLHPYMWVCKSHYYGSTYYNFPYAFGALFARGLYAQYEKEGAAFVPKYKQLLYTTTVASAEDTAKVAGIDLTDKNFWRGALDIIAKQIDTFCALVEKA